LPGFTGVEGLGDPAVEEDVAGEGLVVLVAGFLAESRQGAAGLDEVREVPGGPPQDVEALHAVEGRRESATGPKAARADPASPPPSAAASPLRSPIPREIPRWRR
jgi:hypothetical protein